MISMSKDEIPCSNCAKWNPKVKNFACNPNQCERLSDWLLRHANVEEAPIEQELIVAEPQVQYIV